MPIYEFRCRGCNRRTSVFVRSISATVSAACQHCGSRDLSRLFSRVAVLRSEDGMASGIDESSLGEVDENDPRSVARWVRRMSREMGEPLEPEMEADLERLEAGDMPDEGFGDDDDDEEGEFGDLH